MPFIEELAQGAATQAASGLVGAGMGLLLEKHNDKRQIKQQQKLTDMQLAAQKTMGIFNREQAMKMWEDTNIPAQVAMYEKAGMNPALMYGMGGGGGTTAATAPGTATGGHAPEGGREIIESTGMGIQLQLMQAQKEVLESQANLNNTQAGKIGGVDTEEAKGRILNLAAGTENTQAETALKKVETQIRQVEARIKGETADDSIELIGWNLSKMQEEVENLWRQNLIGKATMNDKIDTVKAEMLGAFLQNEQTRAQTEKTTTESTATKFLTGLELQKYVTNKVQKWKELELMGRNADTNRMSEQHNEQINDMAETTGLPVSIIEKAVQAIFFRDLIRGGKPQEVKGFRR